MDPSNTVFFVVHQRIRRPVHFGLSRDDQHGYKSPRPSTCHDRLTTGVFYALAFAPSSKK